MYRAYHIMCWSHPVNEAYRGVVRTETYLATRIWIYVY